MWLWPKPRCQWQDCERRQGKGRCDSSTRNGRSVRFPTSSWAFMLVLALVSVVSTVEAFGVGMVGVHLGGETLGSRLFMVVEEEEEEVLGDGDLDSPGTVIEDLSWRVAKLRLEEANRKRFLKARPRYLPYDECRKWVEAWNRWDSEQDWYVLLVKRQITILSLLSPSLTLQSIV